MTVRGGKSSPERFERVQELFWDALEREPAARSSFLFELQARDAEMAREVESLLAADARAEGFLAGPPGDLRQALEQLKRATSDPAVPGAGTFEMNAIEPEPGQVPERIGRYSIVRPLGEGGIGVVYLAEQNEPVKRQVALKVIKPGMDSREVVARFQAERQALAVMDHPNIAQVYDGGTTEAGHPYFVMELVPGEPLTAYCDSRKLSLRKRLDLFLDVCDAVQHAHQKGVIHRDLKPSNILVSENGTPVPKVIDFGIAKATGQRLSEQTIRTRTGYVIGTPAYMSPEQAESSGLDIDTRTDVYSLGVILYELLSGELPFEPPQLQGLAAIYTLLEVEPPRPSVRYTSLGADLQTSIAVQRRTDPGTLRKRLHGDLDWIVMKAMEKERARRYETADRLAMDISRHLDEQPVLARPPTVSYRLKKFARRNRIAVLAGAGAAIALIAGTVASTAGFLLATQRAALAESRELAMLAVNTLEHSPERGLLQALEAVQRAETREAVSALYSAVGVSHPFAVLRGHSDRIGQAEFSPDGRRLVTASADGTARIWHVDTAEELAVLRGHDGPVWHAAFSPDGELIATAGADGTARLWSAEAGTEVSVLRGHEDEVNHVSFSPDGGRVLTASGDGTSRVWSTATGVELGVLRGHRAAVYAAQFSPAGDRVVTASDDSTARLWRAATGESLAVLIGHGDMVNYATFSPDGRRVVTVSWDPTARLWDAETGEQLAVLRGHTGQVWHAEFSPDGRRVLTTSSDGTARLWSAETAEQLAVLDGASGAVWHGAFTPDGERVATAGEGAAWLWSAETGREITALRGHGSRIDHLAIAPDGEWLVTASFDGTARLWRLDEPAVLGRRADPIVDAAFSPDGRRVLTGSRDGTARLWSVSTGEELAAWRGHEGPLQLALSPDGERAVTVGYPDPAARVWATRTGEELGVLRGHEAPIFDLRFSPDGERILTASWDGTARLWSLDAGEPLAVLRGHRGRVQHAVFSPDGARMLTAGQDSTARIWSGASGEELVALRGHGGHVGQAVFSPDGERILTASYDSTARLWSAATGAELAVLRHDGFVLDVAFSPDGRRALTASRDNAARLWSAESGRQLVQLTGHQGDVGIANFSPDGSQVVTASDDGTVRLWRVESGEVIAVLRNLGQVTHASFSPDGRRLLTAGWDSRTRLWPVALEELVELAESRLPVTLTSEERADLLRR